MCFAGITMANNGEIAALDHRTDPFGCDHRLRKIGVQEEGGKFFSAESRGSVAASHNTYNAGANLLKCTAACQMAVIVIHVLEMVHVHHQNAETAVLCFCACRFATQFGKEGTAGKQPGQVVVRDEAMDLPLVLAVDLIEQVKPKDMLADRDLVAVVKDVFGDPLAVDESTIAGLTVGQDVSCVAGFGVADSNDLSVDPRHFAVIDANVRLERSAHSYLFAFERNRDSDQLSAQKNKSGPDIAKLSFRTCHRNIISHSWKSPPEVAKITVCIVHKKIGAGRRAESPTDRIT